MITIEKIKKLLSEKQWKISELSDALGISRQIIHRHLKKLLEEGEVRKIGTPPVVYYQIAEKQPHIDYALQAEVQDLIQENFLFIDADGARYDGLDAFVRWCQKRNFDVISKSQEYVAVYKKYQQYFKNGVIDAGFKLQESFVEVFLDNLYYLDFYSVEVFGKTKLGQMLLYAKQSQNKKIMKDVVAMVSEKIETFSIAGNYDAIVFVAPTVKRETQFMTYLEKNLNLGLAKIKVQKIQTEVVVPQKTLKKKEDRIKNADTTFVVSEHRKFKKVLIIDDAVGSGATIHQIAMKLKKQNITEYVDGLALVGSFNGFDILNEV